MKIAIDISQLAYSGTGVANYTAELVRSLLKIDQENEYILFGISLRQQDILKKFYNSVTSFNKKTIAKFLPIPQTVGNLLWNQIHYLNIDAILGKIDIFHSSDWIQPPTSAKKVTTIHDLIVIKYPETSHANIIETQKKRLYWVKREIDLVFADSYSTKDDLTKILQLNPAKIEVVYPGIRSEFRPESEEEIVRVRQKYGLSEEYIFSLGTMEPRKNLKRTVAAFNLFLHHPLVSARKKPLELVIAGNIGWGEQLPVTKYLRIIGFVEQKDLPALYSGASIFIYPSLYEGFGLPVIEAMACGCPVVTSTKGSLKEVAADAALLIDPEMEDDIAIKMTKVVVDDNLRMELIKKGKENAARFNWGKAAGRIMTLYKKLIS